MRVHDVSKKKKKCFFVGAPTFCTRGLPGRGTRGFVALDLKPCDKKKSSKFVWLKDVWRTDDPRILQEGLILERLNRHEVSCVPTLWYHGDVPDSLLDEDGNSIWSNDNDISDYASSSADEKDSYEEDLDDSDVTKTQRTETRDFWEETDLQANPFKSHVHYRMVVREVARPLKEVRNGRVLAIVLCFCLIGVFLLGFVRY